MPYVTVWVDKTDCDCDCKGDCDRGKIADVLEDRIDAALVSIVQGRSHEVEAILRGDAYVIRRVPAQNQSIAYSLFQKGELPGFAKWGQP
jgi:hypothetical protein